MLSLNFENGNAAFLYNNTPIFDKLSIEINYRTGKKAILAPVGKKQGKILFSAEGGDTFCLYGVKINSALVLKIEGSLIHDHTLEPTAFAEQESFSLRFTPCAVKGIMANYQCSPWWTRPAFADSMGALPKKTLSMLADLGEQTYLHAYPMCDDIYRTCLVGEGDTARLTATIGCDGHCKVSGVLMAVGVGSDPYATVHDTMAAGFSAVKEPIPLKDGRRDIEALNLLGWCTYDAFYREVTHDKIITKLKEFKEKNIPVKMLLIDSGWFVHNGDGKRVSGHVKAADVEGIDGDEFLCYLSNSNTFKLVKKNEQIPLELDKNQGELAVFAPVKDGFAVLGLTEKYVSPATVIYSEPRFALITEGGSLAFYSKEAVNKVLADGTEVPFKQIPQGVYLAQIPQSEGDISVTIE